MHAIRNEPQSRIQYKVRTSQVNTIIYNTHRKGRQKLIINLLVAKYTVSLARMHELTDASTGTTTYEELVL